MPAADVLITPVWVWSAPLGVDRPYEDVAYGANWAGWKRLGYTSAPLTANLERSRINKMVEQSRTKIGSVVSEENLTLETTLAELTLDNLALAWGGRVTHQAAGTGQTGYELLRGGGQISLETLQWGMEGLYTNPDGVDLPLRLFVIGEAQLGGQLTFAKSEQVGIPLRVEASFDFDTGLLYDWIKVIAPATA
ncbi:MAG: hypothetical protein C4589_00190 [Peptococcaceae bacterium]|jgi:hypothetical protein|nr:MAG: hypothetical protein C4589_00190 [Peptococcaceae bacterium]